MSSDVFGDPDAKHWRWLDVMPWYASADWTKPPAEGHADLWSGVVRSLDGDDQWFAWWTRHAPRPNCSLYPYFQDEDDKAAVGPADLRRHQLIASREGLEQTPDDVRVYISVTTQTGTRPRTWRPWHVDRSCPPLRWPRRG